MKRMKKYLSILLALMMVICAVPMSTITAGAEGTATSGTCGENVTWNYDAETYTLTISGEGEMDNYSSGNRPWEEYVNDVVSLVIEYGVTSIDNNAFYHCTNLSNITVDSNNEYYSSDEYGVLFNKDKTTLIQYPIGNLRTSYTIPESVTSVEDWSFGYAGNIVAVVIPNSVTSIGDNAFYCTSIINITIPDSVETIGKEALGCCENLVSVEIGFSVNLIGNEAFLNCRKLTYIAVNVNNQYYSSDEYGALFNMDKTILVQYPIGNARTSYTIPDTVSSIGDYAFSSCSSLINITIPDSVISICDDAFRDCNSLTNAIIPDSVISIGKQAFFNCRSLVYIEIGKSVESIGDYVFAGCVNLSNIVVNEDNQHYSSDECGVLFNKDKTTLIKYPVANNRTIYRIPDGATGVEKYAFEKCERLTSITIPASVLVVKEGAFMWCSNLADVYYGGTPEQVTAVEIDEHNEWLTNATIHYNNCSGYRIYEVVSPSCTEAGYTTYVCDCGYTYTADETDALGHNYEDNYCTVCGAPDPSVSDVVRGDVNFDGVVNAIDARKVLQYVAALISLSDEQILAADTSRNGNVSVMDARIILQSISDLNKIPDEEIISGVSSIETPDIALSANSNAVNVGDIITLDVVLPENSGISCITADICFDPDNYEIVSTTGGTINATVNRNYDNGKVRVACAAVLTYEESDSICQVQLRVLDTENTEISLNVVEAYDDNYDIILIPAKSIDFCSEHIYSEWSVVEESSCCSYGYEESSCINCGFTIIRELPLDSHNYENGYCTVCGEADPDYIPETPDDTFAFSIQTPSTATIRYGDGIVLHANVEGNLPDGAYIRWTADNKNFTYTASDDGMSLTAISANNGDTTFYAIVYNADGEIIAADSVTLTSNAGFLQKLAGLFRTLFGLDKILEF